MRLPRLSFVQRLLAALGAAGLIVLFCLGLVWRNPSVFWNDDYQVSILPVFADVARSWREGHWPLLSPYSWACGNLAGEYQYGTFSLFVNAVVVFVFAVWTSFPAQAAALSTVHLAALGTGAYLLARGRRLPAGLAVSVALVGALNGWEIGWGATDWFGALAADAWLPWAWWAFERAMRTDRDGRAARLRWLLPAPFVYLVLTGGFPYTVVRLGLVTAWLGARALAGKRRQALWPLALGWVLGLMLSAPAWLSLLESIHGSSRSGGAGIGNFSWTVPIRALPGLVLPNWTTTWTDFSARASPHSALELTGGLVPLAALLAAFACRRTRAWRALRWDLALVAAALTLCMLPSPGMFRWSFRWLPLFHLAFALSGARALHLLASRRRPGPMAEASLWALGLTAVTWLAMAATGSANGDRVTWYLPLWTLTVAAGWLGLAIAVGRRSTGALWLPAAAAFAVLWVAYTHQYTNPGLPMYAFGPSLAKVAPLSADRLYLSLYLEVDKNYAFGKTPPDFGAVVRPGSTGMFAGIRTVNGYSPIMPPGIGRAWDLETHGSISIDIARRLLAQEAGPGGQLERLGIDGLLVAHDFPVQDTGFPTAEWEPVFSSPEGTVYHSRNGPLPEQDVWAIGASGKPQPIGNTLMQLENSRSGVVLDVSSLPDDQPLLLTFHRAYFPGYVADLDGKRLPVFTSEDSLTPAVLLPAGKHNRLILRYRPRAVVWGASLAAVALLAAGAFAADAWRRGVRAGRTGAVLP